ncbi:unnamed protein product [Rhizopus stolonifer]
MNDVIKPKDVKRSISAPLVKKKDLEHTLPNIPTKTSSVDPKGSVHKNARARSITPQMKKSLTMSLTHKKTRPKLNEEDEPLVKPISIAEKRARQAKRAYQVKIWKVREEREAREARSLLRKKMMNGESKKVENTVNTTMKKKGVRFNLKKNRIIQFTEEKT